MSWRKMETAVQDKLDEDKCSVLDYATVAVIRHKSRKSSHINTDILFVSLLVFRTTVKFYYTYIKHL